MTYIPDDYGLVIADAPYPVYRLPLGVEDERYYHVSAINFLAGRELTAFNVISESPGITVDSAVKNGPIVSFRASEGQPGYQVIKITFRTGNAKIVRRVCIQVK